MTVNTRTRRYDINKAGYANRIARPRSLFSCLASEMDYKEKYEIAKQLRKHGTRFSAKYLAAHFTLEELQRKLNWLNGCISSI